jgi:hypothetical protein
VLHLAINFSYRADAMSCFLFRCQVLAGGFLSATLATFACSLPVPLAGMASRSTGRFEEHPAALLGNGRRERIRWPIDETYHQCEISGEFL